MTQKTIAAAVAALLVLSGAAYARPANSEDTNPQKTGFVDRYDMGGASAKADQQKSGFVDHYDMGGASAKADQQKSGFVDQYDMGGASAKAQPRN